MKEAVVIVALSVALVSCGGGAAESLSPATGGLPPFPDAPSRPDTVLSPTADTLVPAPTGASPIGDIGRQLDYETYSSSVPIKVDALLASYGNGGATGFNQRVPVLLKLSANKLLIFNCEFSIDGVAGDGYGQRLVYRQVDLDPVTRSAVIGSRKLLAAPSDNTHTNNHIQAVRIRAGVNEGRIVALYQDMKVGGYARVNLIYSDDDGARWSAPRAIDTSAFSPFTVLGPSSIVEIPSGALRGRLIAPVYGGPAFNKIGLLISDDGGTNWSMASELAGEQFGVPYINETAVTLVGGNELMLVSRSDPTTGRSLITRSPDGGETLQSVKNPPILSTGQTSATLVTLPDDFTRGTSKIAWVGSSPVFTPYSRTRARIRISYDGGTTFPVEYAPFADSEPFGYSSAQALDASTLAIAYEVPVGGNANMRESIRLLVVNMAEIVRHASGY